MRGIVNVFTFVLFSAIAVLATFFLGLIPLALWAFFALAGSKSRKANVGMKLKSTLMADETIVHFAIQFRPYALLSRRAALAVTTSRVIIIKRGILGGFKMIDFQWKDLLDVKIEENVLAGTFGSNLMFVFAEFEDPSSPQSIEYIEGIDGNAASQSYSYAQAQEQAWEEKRRIRGLEDKRAMAGGVTVNSPSVSQSDTRAQPTHAPVTLPEMRVSSGNSILDDINRAKELLDEGAITDSEFQEIKSKILSRNY